SPDPARPPPGAWPGPGTRPRDRVAGSWAPPGTLHEEGEQAGRLLVELLGDVDLDGDQVIAALASGPLGTLALEPELDAAGGPGGDLDAGLTGQGRDVDERT